MTLLKPENLCPFEDAWKPPKGDAVKEVLERAGLTGKQAAQLTGTANDRTVRRWTGDETPVPYAVWALLCDAAGLGQIWRKAQIPND
jgi:hypothetical protein